MKKLITILILLTTAGACISNHGISKKRDLIFLFTCCYTNNKVSFYINDFEIFKNLELVSDQVLSVTPVHVLYSNEGIITIYKNSDIIDQKELKLTENSIKVTIEINGKRTIKEIDLSKGRFIDIDGSGAANKAYIKQHKKTMVLD